MLITKDGLKFPVEVVDPEGAQLVAKGEFREASTDEREAYYEHLNAHPELTTAVAKAQAAREAGLEPSLTNPSQAIHTTPQVGNVEDTTPLKTATGIAQAPNDGEHSDHNDYAVSSEVTSDKTPAERAEEQIQAHNATTPEGNKSRRSRAAKAEDGAEG